MRNHKSNGSSTIKRAKHTNRKKSNGGETLEEKVNHLETDLTLQLEVLKAEKAGLLELLEKTRGELREAEARQTMAPVVRNESINRGEFCLTNVVLTEEQILHIQDSILDFFGCEDLQAWKGEMETFIQGWVGSGMAIELGPEDRSERLFSYFMIVKFMEELAPFFPTVKKGYQTEFRSAAQ